MAFTRVQGITGATENHTTDDVDITLPSTTTSTNFLGAWVSSWGSDQEVLTVTDTYGNTWQRYGTVNRVSSQETIEFWYAKNIIGGASHQVFFTFKNVDNYGISMAEYSSNVGIIDVDQGAFAGNGTTGTTATTGSITPTQANALLWAGGTDSRGNTTTVVAGTGYTLRGMAGTSVNSVRIYSEDRILVTPASTNATFTSLQSGSRWAASLISLKEVAAPSAYPVGTLMMMGCGI